MSDWAAIGAVKDTDGKRRCGWCVSSDDYRAYHDDEWGRPVTDEVRLFEKLCLEGFQSGLAWITILRKRDNFRAAFAGFDPETVAGYGDADVARLLGDAGIVRHRGKIEATIANAQAVLGLRAAGIDLVDLVWSHEPRRRGRPVPKVLGDLTSTTAESTALSKELKRRGFRFVGPTTAFAAMQSWGVVNDHLAGCHVRTACDTERSQMLT